MRGIANPDAPGHIQAVVVPGDDHATAAGQTQRAYEAREHRQALERRTEPSPLPTCDDDSPETHGSR